MDTSENMGGTSAPGMYAGAASLGDSSRALARSKDELMNDFRNLISAGDVLLRSTASLTDEALAQARERFRGRLVDAKARASEVSRVAMDRGRQTAAATDDYVRANPWPAIGIAASLGFVIAALLVRR